MNQVATRRALWKPLLFFCFWLLSQLLLLCHVMKMCHVCCYNNSDATFRLLMSGEINSNPDPVSASTAGKINCLVMNARSLESYHKDRKTNWQSVCNLHRFQDLLYAENSYVICVNETWLGHVGTQLVFSATPGWTLISKGRGCSSEILC